MRSHAKASPAGSNSGPRGWIGSSLALCVVASALLLAASASAAPTRQVASFSPIDGSSTGVSFGKPSGVAIDEAVNPGNLFLSDSSGGAVDVFGPEGEVPPGVASPYFLGGFSFNGEPSGVAVDNSSSSSEGDLYVGAAGAPRVTKYTLNGSEEYELVEELSASPAFVEVLGVAVDPSSGNVWVADYANGLFEFSPGGAEIERITATNSPSSIAVDSLGDVFVQQYGSGAVFKYAANGSGEVEPGATPTEILSTGATGLAVDPATDRLFVALGDHVAEYDALSGDEVNSFGSGTLSATERVAVDSATDTVYVADPGNLEIDAFGPLVDLAGATTEAATAVHHTDAVLHGHLDPGEGEVTACEFEWGETTSYAGGTVPCNEGDDFDSPADVTANLNFLTPGTTIHFRLHIATTSSGDLDGEDESFTPPPFPFARNQIATFGPDGTAGTSFHNPEALAVDPANGDLYVLDTEAGTVTKFDSSGAPSDFSALGTNVLSGFSFDHPSGSGIAVAPAGAAGGTGGDIYVTDSLAGPVRIFAHDGAELGSLDGSGASPLSGGEICGVAVDQSGDVYLAHFSKHVDRYAPTSNPVTESDFDSQVVNELSGCGVAADSSGSAYAAAWAAGVGGNLNKYLASDFGTGTFGTAFAFEAAAVSVDPSNDDVYVAQRTRVAQFNSSGLQLSTVGEGDLSNSHGVAVEGSNGKLYASDSADGKVHVFSSAVPQELPTITPRDATAITPNSATLNAAVDPETFTVTDCHFDYGTTASYGQTAACVPSPGSGSGDVDVSASLAGLNPQTTYHFRIVASNGNTPGTATGPDQSFETSPAVKDLVTNPATAVTATSATLNGSLDPDGNPLSDCHFDYADDASFQAHGFAAAAEAPCAPDPGSGSGAVAVAADIAGLNGGTVYHFRLQATNAFGTTDGSTLEFTTPGPTVAAQAAEEVGVSDTILTARINPKGAATTYHVEYGTTGSYGQSTAESAPIGFAGDDSGHAVSVHIGGLQTGTAYHFRFVATSAAGVTRGSDTTFSTYSGSQALAPCPNDALRGGFGAALPDCRAYEQVTPVDKHGANIQGSVNLVQASGAGDRITFYLNGGLPTTGGSSSLSAFMASRGSGSWSSDGLIAPTDPGFASSVAGWSDDLSTTAVTAPGPGNVGTALYLRDSSSGAFHPTPVQSGASTTAIAGFAADTSQMIFEAEAALAPGAVGGKSNLYELDDGDLSLVGRIPAGSATSCDDAQGPACVPAPEGSIAGPYNWLNLPCAGDGGGAACAYYTQNTISRDGSRAFFTAAGSHQLYLREDGSRTIQVSASQRAVPDPNGEKPAAFVAATPDGSRVFFLSCGKLTDDSTAFSTEADSCSERPSGTPKQAQDLYAYDVGSGQLTDLSVDAGDPRGAEVQGIVGVSDDGSYVYFVAKGALAPGATTESCDGLPAGQGCNLYLSHEGTITHIASLGGGFGGGGDTNDWEPNNSGNGFEPKSSRVTPDGRTLLFSSEHSLTGYANSPRAEGACGSGRTPCSEFFRYSAPSEEVACVSCNPTGIPPRGNAVLGSVRTFLSASPNSTFLIRNLSADGSRVFFDTADPLLPIDTNGVKDAYEWEAKGSGSCDSENQAGGCIYLLSSGTSPDPSYFADASTDGSHAFFFTSQPLVPADSDHLVDIYDAGVDGGLAAQHALTPPTCTSAACQANPPPPPDQGAASAVFSGPGNLHKATPAARRCAKSQRKVRRGGRTRCVKKRARNRHHRPTQKRANDNRGGSK